MAGESNQDEVNHFSHKLKGDHQLIVAKADKITITMAGVHHHNHSRTYHSRIYHQHNLQYQFQQEQRRYTASLQHHHQRQLTLHQTILRLATIHQTTTHLDLHPITLHPITLHPINLHQATTINHPDLLRLTMVLHQTATITHQHGKLTISLPAQPTPIPAAAGATVHSHKANNQPRDQHLNQSQRNRLRGCSRNLRRIMVGRGMDRCRRRRTMVGGGLVGMGMALLLRLSPSLIVIKGEGVGGRRVRRGNRSGRVLGWRVVKGWRVARETSPVRWRGGRMCEVNSWFMAGQKHRSSCNPYLLLRSIS